MLVEHMDAVAGDGGLHRPLVDLQRGLLGAAAFDLGLLAVGADFLLPSKLPVPAK